MNKRALLLTAAVVALLSGPAFADTTISTATTTALATSTAGNISIPSSAGSITITQAGPVIKIDSDNTVTNLSGKLSNKNTTGAIGVEINAGHGASTTTIATYSGTLDTIDLSGTGTNKTGFLIDLPTSALTGTLDTNGVPITVNTVTVVGDNSFGIHVLPGVTLDGSLLVNGAVSVTSSTKSAGAATNVVGVEMDGNMTGNLEFDNSGLGSSVIATGAGARGVVVLGSIDGVFSNGGQIETIGTSTSSSSSGSTSTTGNPQGGSAVTIAGSVTGGIYNGGPDSSDSPTPAAQILSQGTGPAFLITSAQSLSGSPLNIGVYIGDLTNPGYSFYNRGQISTQPANVNVGSIGMRISGTTALPVTLEGYGMFNSGLISASGGTDTSGPSTGVPVTALWIDDFATVPSLLNTSEAGTGHGNIQASVSGASPAQAIAILINKDTSGSGSLGSITNSGAITATATSSDTKIGFLNATAIDDLAGSLTSITNTGLISASTTTLDNNLQQHIALNSITNTHDLNFQNSGTVIGDVFFGSGNDTLHVYGTSSSTASVTGNINFNGASGADTLTIGDHAQVAGAVLETGGSYVNVTVGTGGTGSALFVNNTDFTTFSNDDNGKFEVGTLDVKSGATLGLTLSQGFNRAVDINNPVLVSTENSGSSGVITLESGSKLQVSFGSFVSTPEGEPAKFVLFDSQNITFGDPDSIRDSILGSIPFLFTGDVCGYNISGFNNLDPSACTDTPSHEQLVANLQPKNVDDLQLTGYARQIFPYVNSALASDNKLGAAVIAAGVGLSSTNTTDVATGNALYQDLYSQFAPDITGGGRAIVVSLTDQATSVLGAHQRALRMYAGKDSAATLWGQEFVQRLDNGTNNPNGFRDSGFGFALGADGGSPASGRYGGAFTFFSGDILEKVPAQVKTSTEWYMLSGYTDWRGKGLFFDSQVTAGYGSLSGRRDIFVKDSNNDLLLARAATNKRASLLAAGGFSTGAVMNMGTLVFMPQFSMDAMTLRENGYKETGGGNGFDLTVDPYYAKSLRGYLGASLREDLNVGGFYLQPEARAGYRYDFLADPVKLKAIFAADPDATRFTLTGPDPAKGSMVLGAGIATTTGNWSLGLNYDFLSGGGLTQQAGTLTLVGRL